MLRDLGLQRRIVLTIDRPPHMHGKSAIRQLVRQADIANQRPRKRPAEKDKPEDGRCGGVIWLRNSRIHRGTVSYSPGLRKGRPPVKPRRPLTGGSIVTRRTSARHQPHERGH